MTSFKPLLVTVGLILLVGLFMNVIVEPFLEPSDAVDNDILDGLIDFVENGFTFTIFGLDFSMNPASWFWFGIDSVTDFVVEQLTLFTYITEEISLVIIILSILALAFSVVSLVRGN